MRVASRVLPPGFALTGPAECCAPAGTAIATARTTAITPVPMPIFMPNISPSYLPVRRCGDLMPRRLDLAIQGSVRRGQASVMTGWNAVL